MGDGARTRWRVEVDVPDAEAYATLSRDRVWNCFAIADLTPPYRAYSHYAVAERAGTGEAAACMVLQHPSFTMLIPSGDPAGVATILERLDLPAETQVQVRAEHVPALGRKYGPLSGPRELLRMGVTIGTFRPPARNTPQVTPLGRDDLEALLALYRHYPEGVFRAEHLEHGAFYGAYGDRQLVAAGGTHIVAERYELGVLGSIFTHPAWRGRGYGTALTSAIVQNLFARGCTDAMLTVGATNAPAIRLYATLGFAVHCRYRSGTVTLLKEGTRRQW